MNDTLSIEVGTLLRVSERDDGMVVSVADFIAVLNDGVAAMPEETRASASIKLWCSGDYANAYMELLREETAEERAKREGEEARRAQRDRDEEHDSELMLYERLKRKFG